jgi:SAM-dependent methyltransferase
MSASTSSASAALSGIWPDWAQDLLMPAEPGSSLRFDGRDYVAADGMLRSSALLSQTQAATKDAFSFIWADEDRFESPDAQEKLRLWYIENYGDVANAPWWSDYGAAPIVLEAGCGKGLSGSLTFGPRLTSLRYLGVDVSNAIFNAIKRYTRLGAHAAFLQDDLTNLPVRDASIDVIYSQGVMHHTDSTETALKALARKLKPGGRFLFYVYRRKGPIREFTDDMIRDRISGMSEQQKWDAMMPLTKLGVALGELDLTVNVPEDIDLLDIPAGEIDIQRLFYWHIFKAFHSDEFSLEELNHINLDWYAPANAHRHTEEEIRRWCDEAGLDVEREHIQTAGISIIARRRPEGAG